MDIDMHMKPRILLLNENSTLYVLVDENGRPIGTGTREVCNALLRMISRHPSPLEVSPPTQKWPGEDKLVVETYSQQPAIPQESFATRLRRWGRSLGCIAKNIIQREEPSSDFH